jgi:hypothetical protein
MAHTERGAYIESGIINYQRIRAGAGKEVIHEQHP